MASRHAIARRLRSLSIVNTKCGVANTPPPNSASTTFATDHTIVPYTEWGTVSALIESLLPLFIKVPIIPVGASIRILILLILSS